MKYKYTIKQYDGDGWYVTYKRTGVTDIPEIKTEEDVWNIVYKSRRICDCYGMPQVSDTMRVYMLENGEFETHTHYNRVVEYTPLTEKGGEEA